MHRLKREFPHLVIAINGGITTSEQVERELEGVDGVMVGREAYHNPWWLAQWDSRFLDDVEAPQRTREWVEQRMTEYMAREAKEHGTPWANIARHMLGLRHGLPGARRWRQVWSDHRLKHMEPSDVMALAHGDARATEESLSLT